MKRLLLNTTILLTMLSMVSMETSAHDFEVDGIYYNITSSTENTVEVTYRGTYLSAYENEYSGRVVIPSSFTYGGAVYNVTSIGNYAFFDCVGLTSVVIPNSVTSIGNGVFYGCTGLTSPVYNSTLFAHMPESFSGEYVIPEGIEQICYAAFDKCTGLTSVTIPNSVTSIGSSAFYRCSGLTSVEIPNSVTSIGEEAFRYCSGLTSVVIPDGVTTIGAHAFSSCKGLTSVVIPNSVTSIGVGAFEYCTGLTSPIYTSTLFAYMPESFSGEYVIPEGIEHICSYAFWRCPGLTSVTIPNSVTSIGNYAFSNINQLLSVTSLIKKPFDIDEEVFSLWDQGQYVFDYNKTLYVPIGTKALYKAREGWKKFSNIVEIEVPDGIQDVKTGVEEQMASCKEFYDLNGRRISEPQRGLNIVRMSDGTVHKVVIK